MKLNKLSLNYQKTKCMVINPYGNRYFRNASIFINDNKIEQVSSVKYLGIEIDSQLSWSNQIRKLESDLSQTCGFIYKDGTTWILIA